VSNTRTLSFFEHYAVEYPDWTRASHGFEERRTVFGALIDRCRPRAGEPALCLDLGCGTAALGSLAAARGFDVIAIDGYAEMLVQARQGQARLGAAGIRDFRHARLPLDTLLMDELRGRADLIIASSVVEYLGDPDTDEFFAQCARLLKPRGTALMSFPNRRALYWRVQRLIGSRGPLRGNIATVQQHQSNPERVRERASTHGLSLQSFEYFALPFQKLLDPLPLGRPAWLATLFVAVLAPAR